jgi:hypothetical protein
MTDPVPASRRLAEYFVDQARNHGLIDVKFFPTTDPSLTVDDCAEAMLAALLNPQPSTPLAWESEPF